MNSEIILNNSLLIGKGRDRACYIHPSDNTKCIKVSIVEKDKQSRREPGYYKKLQACEIDWESIARFYGYIDTNLGKGLVFEVVRDFDGEISKSLTYYLEKNLIAENQLHDSLSRIKETLLKYRILIRDLSPNNLLYMRESENNAKLVIIDGLGNSELIPVSSWIGFIGQRTIFRKWRRLIQRLQRTFPAYSLENLI